jgi:hypothetical protein
MDQLPKYPNNGLDDSPAARVKTRTRVRRRRASSKDSEPRAATKDRYRERGNVEAKVGAQAGGHGALPLSNATKMDEDTKPPQTSPFDIGEPQESWQEASESPPPANSTKFRPHPASSYLPVESSPPNISVDEHSKPSGRRIFLGPARVSPVCALNAPKNLMNNPDLLGAGRQCSTTTTPTPEESESDAMEGHTSSPASKTVSSGVTNGLHHMNESSTDTMTQIPVDGKIDPPSPSGINSTLLRNGSTENPEMAFNGLQAATVTEWQPAGLLSMDSEEPESQYALLILNQPIKNLNMLRLIWEKGIFLLWRWHLTIDFNVPFTHEILAFFRIAADGGGNRLADAFKDPCLNEDFEKIVRTYSGERSVRTDTF